MNGSSADAEFWDELIERLGPRAFDTRHGDADPTRKATDEVAAMVLAHVGDDCGSILEIGCGRGRMTVVLAQELDRVTALDVSPSTVALCRQACASCANVEVLCGDHESLRSFDGGAFDVVFSYATLQHVSNHRTVERYVAEAVTHRCPGRKGPAPAAASGSMEQRVLDLGAFVRR